MAKRTYADKWSTDVLEQVASACNVASNAKTEADWELFLNAIYECATALPTTQRAILLLSQEHGLSFSDIGRALNLPHSTVMYNMARAVEIIVEKLKAKSLVDLRVRGESKVAQQIFCEQFRAEEVNAQTRSGFYHGHEPPWFYAGKNLLLDDDDEGGEGAKPPVRRKISAREP